MDWLICSQKFPHYFSSSGITSLPVVIAEWACFSCIFPLSFQREVGEKEINTDTIYCLDSVHWLSLRERILAAVRRVNAWKVKQEAANSGSSDHSVGKWRKPELEPHLWDEKGEIYWYLFLTKFTVLVERQNITENTIWISHVFSHRSYEDHAYSNSSHFNGFSTCLYKTSTLSKVFLC